MEQLYKLPTSKEIAEKGQAEFSLLLKQFPKNARQLFIGSASTRPYYTKFLDVRRCVAGISPEIAFETYIIEVFPREAFTEAEQIINTQAEHFFFYHKKITQQYNWEKYSLFNLLAVRQVAKNYPEYFPAEVVTDTRNWLQNNWKIWADGRGKNCIRYGLLSGFPLDAALAFSQNKGAKEEQSVMSETMYLSYFGANAEKDQEYIQQLDEIFSAIVW